MSGVPHGAKCVCTICNCGTHKCAPGRHRHVPYDPDALRSTYGKSFPGHAGVAPTRAIRRDTIPLSTLPFDGATTHSVDFKGIAGSRALPFKPADGREAVSEDRDFKSEARHKYAGTQGSKRESFAPRSGVITGLPFDGQSTHASDFVAHGDVRPPQPFRLRDSGLGEGPDQRDFTSEGKGQYTDKSYAIQPVSRTRAVSLVPPLKFEGASSHSMDFRGERGLPAAPFRPPAAARTGPEDRDFVSESRMKHNDKGVLPRPRVRSAGELRPSLPFDGKSTSSVDFPGWEGVRPASSARPARMLHTGGADDRDWKSETARHFGAKPLSLRAPIRGAGAWHPSMEDRDFTTEHKGNLSDKGFQKRESFKPRQELHVDGSPFDGTSTAKTDFKEPPSSYRTVRARAPISDLTSRPEDRDFVTDSASNFAPKERPACPAVGLPLRVPAEPGGHAYFGKRDSGRWTPLQHLSLAA